MWLSVGLHRWTTLTLDNTHSEQDRVPVNCHSYNSILTCNENLMWFMIGYFSYTLLPLAGSGSFSYAFPWDSVTTFLTICLYNRASSSTLREKADFFSASVLDNMTTRCHDSKDYSLKENLFLPLTIFLQTILSLHLLWHHLDAQMQFLM